jgi:hypothetical protein
VLDHVDEVLFLEDGRVATRGTHEELLNRARDVDGGAAAARYRTVVGRDLDDETNHDGTDAGEGHERALAGGKERS